MKTLLVGQAPGKKPGKVLDGACGRRLAGLMGLTREEYRRAFHFANLLREFPGEAGKGDAFPMREVRAAATKVWLKGRVVLVGVGVASAFGLRGKPVLKWFEFKGATISIIPHPSGVCRW